MNRRDALLAILALPSGVVQNIHDRNGTSLKFETYNTRIVLNLADKDDEKAGLSEVEVNYKGQQIKFSAKEIWEALTPQLLPQGKLM